jgi:hypothetical protein
MKNTIVTYTADGAKIVWFPATLDEIKKEEQYLESVIAETPDLLRLDTRQTGVYGPYAVFRQLRFATPQSREIIPDILLLSASGDVIVVEVKRSSNPELRDRRVIAQAIDYAASLSALSEEELAELFSHGRENVWISLVNSLFSGDKDPEELAATLLSNIRTGKLHIVVACDKAPVGLYELAKSVSVQSYLSFSLDILEITPFLPDNGATDQIMFVPNVRLSTEIVARTAITVTYQQGSPEPSVSIATASIEEIEANIAAVSREKTWTKGIWYAVNGVQGAELPTLFERCIKRLREDTTLDVALRNDVDAEIKIAQFKNHWRYGDYTTRFEVTPEEWERVFTAIRSARPMEEG